jgi:flagellar FliJ protein
LAKFVFKLQALLRQRKHVERQWQRELAARQQALVRCQDELRELNDRVQATSDEVRRNHLVGVLDMSLLTAHRRYLLASQRQALAIAQKIAAAQSGVSEAQTALTEAAKQRKIIEKLREKQLARRQEEEHRREMNAADELNVQLAYEQIQLEAGR